MTINVGDKVILIPNGRGGYLAQKPFAPSVGDKVLLIPDGKGGYIVTKMTVPQIGDKLLVFPQHNNENLVYSPAYTNLLSWGTGATSYTIDPEPFGRFVEIDAGSYHAIAMNANGAITAWGTNTDNCCDIDINDTYIAIAAGKPHFASPSHTLAVTSGGELKAWGNNDYGQCTCPAGSDYVKCSAGMAHSVALDSSGNVTCWGDNTYGQCDIPAGTYTAISAGQNHTLALKDDGSVVSVGDPYYHFDSAPAGTDFVKIAAGYYVSVFLKSDGSLTCYYPWVFPSSLWQEATPPAGTDYVEIGAGRHNNYAIKSDGSAVGWGLNLAGEITIPAGYTFEKIDGGVSYTLAIIS